MATFQNFASYRGFTVLYSPEYDSYNVRDDRGGWIVDGASSLDEAKAWLDYYLKPRKRNPLVGGLWDSCPLEYITERGE